MNELLAIFGRITTGLSKLGTSAVLREQVALIERELRFAKEEATKLNQENARLVEALREATEQLQAQRVGNEYTHHRGALFRREASGKYDGVVYCPKCRGSASAFPPDDRSASFCCDACRWFSPFTVGELPAVMASIVTRAE